MPPDCVRPLGLSKGIGTRTRQVGSMYMEGLWEFWQCIQTIITHWRSPLYPDLKRFGRVRYINKSIFRRK
jgi:hypothetical protein